MCKKGEHHHVEVAAGLSPDVTSNSPASSANSGCEMGEHHMGTVTGLLPDVISFSVAMEEHPN
eukprot:1131067-Karenia_brevis.AAC.1